MGTDELVVGTNPAARCGRFSQRPNPKVVTKREVVTVGLNSWYHGFPASDPLDVEAGERFKQRQGRLLDPVFKGACELANVEATPRQARKWNNGAGIALRHQNEAKSLL
jgi:hypothetical protein